MNPALITAVAGLVAAIASLIGVWKHINGPKHQPQVIKGAGANDGTNAGGIDKNLPEHIHGS